MPTDWDVNEKSEPIWGLLIHSAVVYQCNVSIDTGLAVLDTFPNPKNLELGRSFGRCRTNKEPCKITFKKWFWSNISREWKFTKSPVSVINTLRNKGPEPVRITRAKTI